MLVRYLVSHVIEIRCKQSDIFAKFIYLRHCLPFFFLSLSLRLFLSCVHIQLHEHKQKQIHAQHSSPRFMRNIGIKHTKQRSKHEVTRNEPKKKVSTRKREWERERDWGKEEKENLFGKQFLSRAVRLMLCCGYTQCSSYFVDCLTFYIYEYYECAFVWICVPKTCVCVRGTFFSSASVCVCVTIFVGVQIGIINLYIHRTWNV